MAHIKKFFLFSFFVIQSIILIHIPYVKFCLKHKYSSGQGKNGLIIYIQTIPIRTNKFELLINNYHLLNSKFYKHNIQIFYITLEIYQNTSCGSLSINTTSCCQQKGHNLNKSHNLNQIVIIYPKISQYLQKIHELNKMVMICSQKYVANKRSICCTQICKKVITYSLFDSSCMVKKNSQQIMFFSKKVCHFKQLQGSKKNSMLLNSP